MDDRKVYHYELMRNEYRDIFEWMQANIPSNHIVKWLADEVSPIAQRVYGFARYRIKISIDDKKSAMLFKLRWANDEDGSIAI